MIDLIEECQDSLDADLSSIAARIIVEHFNDDGLKDDDTIETVEAVEPFPSGEQEEMVGVFEGQSIFRQATVSSESSDASTFSFGLASSPSFGSTDFTFLET